MVSSFYNRIIYVNDLDVNKLLRLSQATVFTVLRMEVRVLGFSLSMWHFTKGLSFFFRKIKIGSKMKKIQQHAKQI